MSAGDKRRMGLANILASALTVQGLFFAPSSRPASLAAMRLFSRGLTPARLRCASFKTRPLFCPGGRFWMRLGSRRFPDARNPEATLQYSAGGSASAGNIKTGSGSREGAVYTINF